MMTIRNVLGLTGVGLCLLLSSTSAVNATVAETAGSKKPKTLKLSEQKAHHPCARKSAQALNKKASPFLQSIHAHAKKYGVDHDLVKSVITIESCYKQKALSPKGAQGLMQLIPATAERFGISNVYDADQNVRGGTKYLSWLSKRFNGDLQKVLAGYNAGEGRVDQYNGIPPFRETRNYVHDVLLVYKKLKARKQQVAEIQTTQEAAKKQAELAREYEKQRLARQRQAQLAEQKRLAAMTPDQRKRAVRQAQLAQKIRQRQQPERQKQLVAQMRQRQQAERQKQLVQQVRQQQARRTASAGQQASHTYEIITGQMSRPIKVQQRPQAPAQQRPQTQAQQRPQAPVLRKVSKKIVRNADGSPVKAQQAQQAGKRVQRTYTSPFKPGRAGREANKRLAPQLYKQQ